MYLVPVRMLNQSPLMVLLPYSGPTSRRRLRPKTKGAQYGQNAVAKAMLLGRAPIATALTILSILELAADTAFAAIFLRDDNEPRFLLFLVLFLLLSLLFPLSSRICSSCSSSSAAIPNLEVSSADIFISSVILRRLSWLSSSRFSSFTTLYSCRGFCLGSGRG